jgi:hypothetical protein
MPISYHDLAASTGVRISALDGSDAPALQITYSKRPLTDADFQSTIFPFDAIRDAILNAEQKLCQAIGKSTDRVLRSYIGSQTVALVSGDELPTLDENGVNIIGDFGAVVDSSNPAILCTRMPLKVVERRNLAPALWLLGGAIYAMDGTRIIHSQAGVVLECCVYDGATQTTAFDQDSTILLPDTFAEAYINGALAMLMRDDEFIDQAGRFATYFATSLAAIPAGQMEAQPV